MALWGTDGDVTTNKPKWCPDDVNSKYDVTTVFANQSGWVRRAGSSATGNGNTDADPEILVAIGGLAGATASTGLKHPTMTKYRVLTSTAHGTTGNITFEITWDEQVKYVAGSVATLVLTAGSGTNQLHLQLMLMVLLSLMVQLVIHFVLQRQVTLLQLMTLRMMLQCKTEQTFKMLLLEPH